MGVVFELPSEESRLPCDIKVDRSTVDLYSGLRSEIKFTDNGELKPANGFPDNSGKVQFPQIGERIGRITADYATYNTGRAELIEQEETASGIAAAGFVLGKASAIDSELEPDEVSFEQVYVALRDITNNMPRESSTSFLDGVMTFCRFVNPAKNRIGSFERQEVLGLTYPVDFYNSLVAGYERGFEQNFEYQIELTDGW